VFDGDGNPQTPYWGLLLASKLAQPGAQLSVDTTDQNPSILAFKSTLADGHQAEAYINLSTATREQTTSAPELKPGLLNVWQYSNDNPTVIQRVSGTLKYVTVPPESVTVLETQ
jgi:hypothetical protein